MPALFLRPNDANHSGPRRRMVGATATVSTLVTVVGQPYRPTLAGKGGFSLGFPCFPSKLSMSAVSSPAFQEEVLKITTVPPLSMQRLKGCSALYRHTAFHTSIYRVRIALHWH